ncbi:MAG: hypothetical protein NW202_13100 [Nitrospira sp.]|nr:hypothetical protein [Nitrospira sp.]
MSTDCSKRETLSLEEATIPNMWEIAAIVEVLERKEIRMLSNNRTALTASFMLILSMSATPTWSGSPQEYCKGVAGESYRLLETCMRGEEEARNRLQSRSLDPQIKAYCKKIADGSYRLMETCIRREEEAKANIQSRQADPQQNTDELTGGEKGKLVSLLVDYADFRHRVQEVRETRRSGYASDTKDLITLAKGIGECIIAAQKFRSAIHIVGVTDNKAEVTASNLIYAYAAMSQIVHAEIDRNIYLSKSDIPLRVAEKHEELWKMIDPSIPVVSIP